MYSNAELTASKIYGGSATYYKKAAFLNTTIEIAQAWHSFKSTLQSLPCAQVSPACSGLIHYYMGEMGEKLTAINKVII